LSEIARVIRADVRSFDCAYPRYTSRPHALGQMLAVREGHYVTFGVVAGSESGPEDPSRPLAPRGKPGQSAAAVMAENPEIAMLLRTELTVVICGHIDREVSRALLPPQPPPLLAEVQPATDDEKLRIGADGGFLVPLVATRDADDAVLAAAIRDVARAFGPDAGEFTISAGKELARLLKAEPSRLTSILRAVEQ